MFNEMMMQMALAATLGRPGGAIPQATRDAVGAALVIVMVVFSIAVMVVVMMQKSSSDNVGVITGTTDTYYGKNKSQTAESRKKTITFVLFGLLFATSITYFIIQIV